MARIPEKVRYLAAGGFWRGDYVDEEWRAMRDGRDVEPEPVDAAWLKVFAQDAQAKREEHRED